MNSRSYQERWNIYMETRANEAVSGKPDSTDILVWDAQLETGIAELDRQHQKLVQLINVLGRLLTAELDSKVHEKSVIRIFDELMDYVDYHFRFKADLMERYHCDKELLNAHINAHADFIRAVAEARASGREDLIEAAGRTLVFLSEWLVRHIFEIDMHMAIYILDVQAGISNEEAARQADSFMRNSPETMRLAMSRLHDELSNWTQALLEAKHASASGAGARWYGDAMRHKH